MPELQSIERLKETINSLGDEPAVLQDRGIILEDVSPPVAQEDNELQELLQDTDLEMEPADLEDRIGEDLDDSDPFADFDTMDEPDLGDSLDLPEEIPSMEDFSLDEDNDSLDEIAPLDDGVGLDDFDLPEDLNDDLAMEPPPIEEDSSSIIEEIDSIDDIDIPEEIPAEGLETMEDLGDGQDLVEDIEPLDDLEPEELASLDEMDIPSLEDGPDIGSALDSLSEELEQAESSGEMDGDLSVTEDFGLNEIEDDFLDDLDSDESDGSFSLEDLGQDFQILEEEQQGKDLGLDLDSLEKSIDDAEEEEHQEDFELTSDDMDQLKAALLPMPRNLKLALEEFMADPQTPVDELNQLIDQLLNRSPIRSIASKLGKYTGKKIEIPRGYQKLNAEEFEKEQNSLVNQFKEKVFPRVLKGLIAFFALWVLFLICFNWVYRPLKAQSLYKEGNEQILLDNYQRAEYLFQEAYQGWNIGNFVVRGVPRKDWFYEYAETYVERRKFDRAIVKYRELLIGYPMEIQARLDYSSLLINHMARYEEAEKILLMANPIHLIEVDRGERQWDEVPVWELVELDNYKLLLALGDCYFYWGEVDADRYEDARYTYAYTRQFEDRGDEITLRMLRYFLHRNISQEVERLMLQFKDKEKIYGEPEIQSEILAELAGWLLDQRRHSEAAIFLEKAKELDPTVPDIHYQYARYFNHLHNRQAEKDALTNALGYLSILDSNRRKYLAMRIDCYKRLGEHMESLGDTLQAEKNYLLAISIFEDVRNRNLMGSWEEIGELYSLVGDLNYREHRNYEAALDYYGKALENFFDPPEIHYRRGYIYYSHLQDYQRALLEFYRCSRALPQDRNVLYAMANTLFLREDYFGALSHYERLLTQLEEERQRTGVLLPEQKEEHLALIIQLMMVHNNLGAAQYKSAERTPNRDGISQALSQFTFSSEFYDRLTRDQATLVRSSVDGQPFVNRSTVLQDQDMDPLDGRDVVIFDQLLTELDGTWNNY